MAGMICPNCGQENPAQNKFCLKCGGSLTARCRRCGTENPLAAQFCGNCSIELATATPGIPFERVALWQETFRKMNWLVQKWESDEQQLNPMLRSFGVEPYIERQEPTLFGVYLINRPWFPKELRINRRKARAGKHNMLWATNCRLFVIVPEWRKEERLWVFSYSEFSNCEIDYGGRISLSTRRGDQIEVSLRLGKVGWFDALMAAFASDPVARARASITGREKIQARRQFMEALALFVKDMVAVGSQ